MPDKKKILVKAVLGIFIFFIICFASIKLFKTQGNHLNPLKILENKISNYVISRIPQCPVNSEGPLDIPVYTYRVVNTYPHDKDAFTEGFLFEKDALFEGTGIKGRSSLRKVNLETGDTLAIYKLPAQFFGEGITIYKDKIIQLTYTSHVGSVFDKKTFKLLRKFRFPTEGWGLTYDEKHLILSDGSSKLYFLDPENFKVVCRMEVRDNNGPVKNLNELEYVKGEIFANIYMSEYIARISPQTGRVTGWINLKGLLNKEEQAKGSLNGIAYDPKKDRLFVTGKFIPKIFEIELLREE